MSKIHLNHLSFNLAGIFFVITLIVQLYLIFLMFNISMINYYSIIIILFLLALQYSIFHRFSLGIVNNICIDNDFLYIDYVRQFKHNVFKIELNKINEQYYPDAPKNPWSVANTIWTVILMVLWILTYLPA